MSTGGSLCEPSAVRMFVSYSRNSPSRSGMMGLLRDQGMLGLYNEAQAASGLGPRHLRDLVAQVLDWDSAKNVEFQVVLAASAETLWDEPRAPQLQGVGEVGGPCSWSTPARCICGPVGSALGHFPFDSLAAAALVEGGRQHALWQMQRRIFLLKAAADPQALVTRFLQQLIMMGRRADSFRQSAVQRLRLACRSAMSSPDRPPGELVLSSARVPRGPDVSRVTSVLVARGEQFALV